MNIVTHDYGFLSYDDDLDIDINENKENLSFLRILLFAIRFNSLNNPCSKNMSC